MSQHFAVFNSNGEFATASLRNNEVYVTLWPKPVKSGRVMTQKKVPTLSCGSDVDFISRYVYTQRGKCKISKLLPLSLSSLLNIIV